MQNEPSSEYRPFRLLDLVFDRSANPKLRSLAHIFTLAGMFALLGLMVSQTWFLQSGVAETKQTTSQPCPTEKPGEPAVSAQDDDRVDAGDQADYNQAEPRLTICLARASLLEADRGNLIATTYNGIAREAADAAKIGGVIVGILGLVSAVGVLVSIFAASDAGRAAVSSADLVDITRRTARAYLEIVMRPDALWPVIVRNVGTTPGTIVAITLAPAPPDTWRDMSLIRWQSAPVGHSMLAPGGEWGTWLGLGDRALERGSDYIIGAIFYDVFNRHWHIWRYVSWNEDAQRHEPRQAGEFLTSACCD